MKKNIDKRTIIGAVAIMSAALLWSLDGVFIRPKLYQFPPALIVLLEHALGFVFLSPLIFINRYRLKTLGRKDWSAVIWVSIFGGLVGTIAITAAFFSAVHGEVTFATVIILQKLQPVFALLLARLILKEYLPGRFYIWAGLAIIGGYFLAFGQTGLALSGIDWLHNAAVFAVVAAFAFGSSTVFGKRIVNHLNYGATTALRFGLTALLALFTVFILGDLGAMSGLEGVHWGLLVLIVFTSGAVALYIYYFGLRRVAASTATVCELSWPFSAVILDYLINGNTLNFIQVLSAVVMIYAVYRIIRINASYRSSFTAQVARGKGRGKRIGSPTINLDKADLDLPHGIYLVKAGIGKKEIFGLMHFGRRETYREPVSLELYLLEDISPVNPEKVDIQIVKYIRKIKKYNSTEKLQIAIQNDIHALKRYVDNV